ncbi:MAG: hypothetical protein ACI9QD_001102 [Thermoproteota archaeon]|jgi:hypothetical protein
MLVNTLKRKVCFFVLILTLFSSQTFSATINWNDWKKFYTEDGITVYKVKNPKKSIIPLMAKAKIEYSLNAILSLLSRQDLRKQWVPRWGGSGVLKNISEFERIEFTVSKVPFPFYNREFIYKTKTTFDKINRTANIDIKTVEWKKLGKGYQRGHIYNGSLILKELSANQVEFTLNFETDPKGYIPKWLVNIVQKKWPFKYLTGLRTQLKTLTKTEYKFKNRNFFK